MLEIQHVSLVRLCSVQFTEWGDGKSAEAVPVSWLMTVGRKLMFYYPKTGRKKAVETRETPRGDWELHESGN